MHSAPPRKIADGNQRILIIAFGWFLSIILFRRTLGIGMGKTFKKLPEGRQREILYAAAEVFAENAHPLCHSLGTNAFAALV